MPVWHICITTSKMTDLQSAWIAAFNHTRSAQQKLLFQWSYAAVLMTLKYSKCSWSSFWTCRSLELYPDRIEISFKALLPAPAANKVGLSNEPVKSSSSLSPAATGIFSKSPDLHFHGLYHLWIIKMFVTSEMITSELIVVSQRSRVVRPIKLCCGSTQHQALWTLVDFACSS